MRKGIDVSCFNDGVDWKDVTNTAHIVLFQRFVETLEVCQWSALLRKLRNLQIRE